MLLPLLFLLPGLQGSQPGFDAGRAIQLATHSAAPRVIELRRAIHAEPELGEREFKTAERVRAELQGLGLEVVSGLGGTGVVGLLRGGKPGPLVAYRADMDALPIEEDTGLAFQSRARDTWNGAEVGVMHACGHDLHTAIGLGVARVLATPELRAELRGSVLFVFQPAEEGLDTPGPHGAQRMLQEGLFAGAKPAAIFGLHCYPALPLGSVSVEARGVLAAVDEFTIRVVGQGTHGAYPHTGVDPIVAASQIVLALQTIASRRIDASESVVVSVCRVLAGNRSNILPNDALLQGTIRTQDEQVQAKVHSELRRICDFTAQAAGAVAEVEIRAITPVTFNDPALVARMRPSVERVLGGEKLLAMRPQMGGEDFAFYARETPGLFYFLGTADPSKGPAAMIHTPHFDPDERALEIGVRVSATLLWDFLSAP